ncbi:U3 small nucleolar RNA-interacting protein 2-like protein [Dinothrombium tinctorium]|uniref:U3 small nucleolar RNA-interacting protein 2 n=1 Tax=Dinothrombium tinctorium TaxID=1965070 RepID=A0A443RAJ7_9ACAR|nr:U3 small nucleolar RNA-interacting protein 2-like protein [Dinothrombium tinctorium]
MSFFVRKSNKFRVKKKDDKKQKKKKAVEFEVSSDSEDDAEINGNLRKRAIEESESEIEETAQEKKVRLAKKYLENIERQEKERLDDNLVDEAVNARLKDEVLEKSGYLFKRIANTYLPPNEDDIRYLKNGHKLPVTCVCVSNDSLYIYSASKDCSIIKWCLNTGKKIKIIPGGRKGTEKSHVGHSACVNCLAISSDDKFLASGCDNKVINIWNPETMELLKSFSGHRDVVTGVAFRKSTHTLYSCSRDKSVKVWNLDEMIYVETLFGHQEPITAIDSLLRERTITAGGRDRSIRVWKIIEESQLIFEGHNGSIDCVKLIDENHFVSAGEDGSICLWDTSKKKPVTEVPHAHGATTSTSNWISSLAVLVNSDLFASGSNDGVIRFWKCSDFKKIDEMFIVSAIGFVNCMQFSANGEYLVAAIGQEHRLGRWWRLKEAKNSVIIIPLRRKNEEDQ